MGRSARTIERAEVYHASPPKRRERRDPVSLLVKNDPGHQAELERAAEWLRTAAELLGRDGLIAQTHHEPDTMVANPFLVSTCCPSSGWERGQPVALHALRGTRPPMTFPPKPRNTRHTSPGSSPPRTMGGPDLAEITDRRARARRLWDVADRANSGSVIRQQVRDVIVARKSLRAAASRAGLPENGRGIAKMRLHVIAALTAVLVFKGGALSGVANCTTKTPDSR